MNIKFRCAHPEAVAPIQKTPGAAAFDLATVGAGIVPAGCAIDFDTGLQFEIPPGYVMHIYSRSGHGFKDDVRLSNCVGVIDSDYRGNVKVKLRNDGTKAFAVCKGDRIAQAIIMPLPAVKFEESFVPLSATERGEKGFGSTDVKPRTIAEMARVVPQQHEGAFDPLSHEPCK